VYVDATTGNDATGKGTQTAPYKTITKALALVASPGPIPVVDVEIAAGHYNAALGEKFPLAIPTGVTINGATYGRGTAKGTFIDGAGEDKVLEKIVDAASGTYYATFEVGTVATQVSITNLYVGNSTPSLPSTATYDSLDILGGVSGTTVSLNAQPKPGAKLNGVLVPGGTFACASCTIGGTAYAVAALTLPGTSPTAPQIALTGPSASGQGSIGGAVRGIQTDGSANVTVSNQTFSSGQYAFADDYAPLATGYGLGTVDFGQGDGSPSSTGGNVLINNQASAKSEILITLANDSVIALGNSWNPGDQGASPHGQYRAIKTFQPGDTGRNVTIDGAATGASVKVGPFIQPTPSPSASPTTSPSGSPTSSPSPTASPT
jgi:hypothetical protein